MEELIKRLERVIQTGAPDKDGMHPISAETVLEVVKQLSEHGTNLAEVGTDCISRQAAIDALENDKAALDEIIKGMSAMDVRLDAYVSQRNQVVYDIDTIEQLPPIQPVSCSEFPNNSDTISRKAATDALRKMQTYKLFSGDDMLLIDQAGAQTELMLLPPAEPKRGEWIRVGSGSLYDN